jgi:Ala-tRNA(Pro) deacylase
MPHTELLSLFEQHDIPFIVHEHPPLFTVDDSAIHSVSIEGGNSKNLFLKDKKNRFHLVSVLDYKRVDLKELSKTLGSKGLSFAHESHLLRLLNLTPGSVSPYGLINDTLHDVQFVLDRDFLTCPIINFHPLRNDMTVSVEPQHFLRFFQIIQHPPSITSIPIIE